jgi:hypothetical protein
MRTRNDSTVDSERGQTEREYSERPQQVAGYPRGQQRIDVASARVDTLKTARPASSDRTASCTFGSTE